MDKTAPEKLRDWMNAEGRKGTWVASKLHTTAPTLSTWLTGKHKPHWAFRNNIEELTGGAVKRSDWE